jgi:hypothetical protein
MTLPLPHNTSPRSNVRAVAAAAIFVGALMFSINGSAADYFVNGACSINGNGTASRCAGGDGGAGAWNSMSAIVAGAAGDVIHIRGGTYNNHQDYFNFPSGRNGMPGKPLIMQNYAGENVAIDGTADLHGSTWTAVGGGAYRCSGGQCTTNKPGLFPIAAWYKRAGQSAEQVLNLKMSGNCDASLPAGYMRYGTSGPVCVHLSDGSNPSYAQYLRIPFYNSGILLNNFKTHDVVLRRNPAGGNFAIQRFVQYGVVLQAGKNTNITLDGLEIAYVMDRCIDADYFGSNDGTNVMANSNYHFLNNNIHHCGQEGIHDSDDSGPDGRIQGNEIHHIQAPPWIERCDTVAGGAGCNVDGLKDQCSAIRLTSGKNYRVSGNYFHDNCGGLNGRGYDFNLEEWFYDTIIENNISYNMAAGVVSTGRTTVSMMMESQRSGPFQNITVRNNRFSVTDHCFTLNVGISGPQAVNYYNNTCADFRVEAIRPGYDVGVTGGSINYVNNIFSAINTKPGNILTVDTSKNTGFQSPQHNAFYCPSCTQIGNWKNSSYSSASIGTLGAGNIYGDPRLSAAPTVRLLGASGSAYQHGVALSPAFPDIDAQARPSSGIWDVGADQFVGTGSAALPAPTNLRVITIF